jgi:ferredoxin-NADP reductase
MPFCSTLRFSTSPLLEWHSFATIPSIDGKEASIVIANAGDWTESNISNPATTLYIRKSPVSNFLVGARMFERILLVATGAGIGPVLSYLMALGEAERQTQRISILWQAHDPAAFGSQILEKMREVDTGAVIQDSSVQRIDVGARAVEIAERKRVEAVYVVGNKKVTDCVTEVCKSVGIPVYGAVFDS